ncbi:hypothetical protein G9H64_12055 [Aquirufa nivalisilvae]|uniref:hypothetical protein n=1 Tax=Aquirufa nivalisilvae TaxID=2516557 RepID=UPI0022A8FA50|nr:hypothetical protein [Aquirufa nivalisilvae]MCZ2481000.1 hypothetical protein [Aquirufa nivalisilvae]MCZ2483692.1 hypothetical protein [Aquirufa nivalisilvae]
MKYSFLLPFVLLTYLSVGQQISNPKHVAQDPSFTRKQDGSLVLSWVEKQGDTVLFFRKIWDKTRQSWSSNELIPIHPEASTHAEGMPKLSYKADGTCILMFELNKPSEKSRFSGDLYYAMEKQGQWSKAQTIHRDTTAGLSHSFGKIFPLANGEVGALWLDVKLGPKGRTLVYAATSLGQGFGEMRVLDKQTCECCRIDALADNQGNIDLIYRDLNDQGERDMAYIHSNDFGKTFTSPVTWMADHWQVNACPHAGPSLVRGPHGLEATWYTGASSGSGIKWAYQDKKELILHLKGDKYRQAQLASNAQGEVALVYAQIKQVGERYFKQIGMYVKDQQGKLRHQWISNSLADCSYPVIHWNGKKWLVAYESWKGEERVIEVREVK